MAAHYENCLVSLDEGVNVSVTKPFTDTVGQAHHIGRLAKSAGKFVSVGQSSRFGAASKIKKWMSDGTMGRPVYADVSAYRDRAQGLSEYQISEPWPVINATLVHLVDQARYWTGGEFCEG